MMSTGKGDHFEVLDAWRGLCALLVLAYHFIFIVNVPIIQNSFLLNSYLFVDFFFVLSGFVVCHAYHARLGTGRQMAGFVLRRVGRLWPLHLAILFAMMLGVMAINMTGHHPDRLLISAESGNYSLWALVLNALLLNAMGLYGTAWNGPAWSIGAEFYTYLLFALAVFAARRYLVWVAAIAALSAMVTLLAFAPAYMNSTADFGFIRCIAGFFTGVVAWHLHVRLREWRLPAASLFELAALVLAGLFITHVGRGPDRVEPVSVLAPFAFAAVILVFARQRGLLSRLLKAAPFQALGRWSFSIYLLHMPVLLALTYGLWLVDDLAGAGLQREVMVGGVAKQLYDIGTPAALALLAAFAVIVVALSALTFRAIEVPWRDGFARIARRYETAGTVRPIRIGPPVPVRVRRDAPRR